jgi:folate-binding protein YgfZ
MPVQAMLHSIWQNETANDPRSEGATGVVWLADLTTITFAGPDVRQFLQGYLTSDALAIGREPRPTAFCNRTGRVVANGLIFGADDTLTLVLHATIADSLLDFLKPYLAFSHTRAACQGGERLVFGALGLPDGADERALDSDRRLLLADTIDTARRIRESAPALASDAWRAAEIERGEVWVCEATRDAFLPQMLGLSPRAVSFDKGCYLGQEIVARAQHRGEVKRALARLDREGQPAPPGTELVTEAGRACGTVVAATTGERLGSALAVLAREIAREIAREPGSVVSDRAGGRYRRADPA